MNLKPDLAGSAVLVTGGTRGIGAAIAIALRECGATVAICGRSHPERQFDGIRFFAGDLRDPEQARDVVGAAADALGRLDVVVNNAGGTGSTPARELKPARAQAVVALNLLAPFYVAQRANAVMQAQATGGTIINIGSSAAARPAPGVALYAAAKSGLLGLTRALALEWAPRVRVNQVTPGPVYTADAARHYGGPDGAAAAAGAMASERMPTPDDIASACVLLASPLAAGVAGAELRVDGGGELPGWLVAVDAAQIA